MDDNKSVKDSCTLRAYNKGDSDTLKKNFTKTPNTLLKAIGDGWIDHKEGIIMIYLYSLVNAGKGNVAYPTLDQIAKGVGMNRKTVNSKMQSLREKGLVAVTKNATQDKGSTYNNNVYKVFYLEENSTDSKKAIEEGNQQ